MQSKENFDHKSLLRAAFEYRERAYAPYSHFKVGAALLTADGQIFGGCNIENSAYSPILCAERTAFAKAVSEGQREFIALAVVGGPEEEQPPLSNYTAPCGVCRQWMQEFCPADMPVLLGRSDADYRLHTCGELLPFGFSL